MDLCTLDGFRTFNYLFPMLVQVQASVKAEEDISNDLEEGSVAMIFGYVDACSPLAEGFEEELKPDIPKNVDCNVHRQEEDADRHATATRALQALIELARSDAWEAENSAARACRRDSLPAVSTLVG